MADSQRLSGWDRRELYWKTYHHPHGPSIDGLRRAEPVVCGAEEELLRRAEEPVGGNDVAVVAFSAPAGYGRGGEMRGKARQKGSETHRNRSRRGLPRFLCPASAVRGLQIIARQSNSRRRWTDLTSGVADVDAVEGDFCVGQGGQGRSASVQRRKRLLQCAMTPSSTPSCM